MSNNYNKTSVLIPSQLPEFVRDDPNYSTFVLFLKAYYEWMEQTNNVTDRTKNLLNYQDIDETTNEFIEYFYNDFLSYFPTDILSDEKKVLKIARELYQSKGTPSSYKFLFRVLYNSDFDVFFTKDAVLRASAGRWYVPRSLKVVPDKITHYRYFENVDGYKVFGETTKSLASIEATVITDSSVEIFIADIERLFESGEYIRIVDANGQDISMPDGDLIRGKIVGQISAINIDPNNRGLLYQPGDPVIVYGGLNSENGVGAEATVGTVTSGSIQSVAVLNGGFGYRTEPNTEIVVTNGGGAIVTVGSVDPSAQNTATIRIPTDYIATKLNVPIGNSIYNFANNVFANANTSLANSFLFTTLTTYPISSTIVQNGGGGITTIPTLQAFSYYSLETAAAGAQGVLSYLGILAPIQIIDGGSGYDINDTITFTGGSGIGAYANVSNVDANGTITTISYVYKPGTTTFNYPLGGMGYSLSGLPTVSVSSNTGSNASIQVTGILGDGARFLPTVDRVGSVTTISVSNYGEDYISTPNVSLKVQDIIVKNLVLADLPQKGDVVYQGVDLESSTYRATVESVSVLQAYGEPTDTLYVLRVYNYNSNPVYGENLLIDGSATISMTMTNELIPDRFNSNGILNYGDGYAKATATFLNGLLIGQGQYLDTTGQPSGFDVLQNTIYNNYTYQITVEKEIAKYREILLNLLHPLGMQVIGRYAIKSNSDFNLTSQNFLNQGYPLAYYTSYTASSVVMETDFDNKSNNIITFENMAGANLDNFVLSNTIVAIKAPNNPEIRSEIESIDSVNNQITLTTNVWLTFANVATIQANANSNLINILTVTNAYDLINNGEYSNTSYPMMDIIRAGDIVKIANNNPLTVSSIDYVGNKIYVSSTIANNSTGLMASRRTIDTTQVTLYNTTDVTSFAEMTTEDGYVITTEDDFSLIAE